MLKFMMKLLRLSLSSSLSLIFLGMWPPPTWAEQAAQVTMLKGEVKALENAQEIPLKQGDWVNENAEVQTGDKSFAKLELKDKSQLTVGPKSKMKIAKGQGKGTGLINLIGGQLRADVSKSDANTGPKLIIKTKNAAMGVRGTKFETSFNQQTGLSNLVTFEGQVANMKIEEGERFTLSQLSSELGSGSVTLVEGGQYSAVNPASTAPMEPVRINPAQVEAMQSNDTLLTEDASNKQRFSSPIPPGAPSEALANRDNSLDNSMGQALGQEGIQLARQIYQEEKSESAGTQGKEFGYNEAGIREGGYYDMRVGYIIPPANSLIDSNTGLAIPPAEAGGVNASGQYLPPEGLEINESGEFVEQASVGTSTQNQQTDATTTTATTSSTYIPVAVSSNEEATEYMEYEAGSSADRNTSSNANSVDELIDEVVEENTSDLADSSNTSSSTSTSTDVTFNVSVGN